MVIGLLERIGMKAPEVLKGANGLTLSQKDIAEFGDVVGDYSDLHRKVKVATDNGFEDTPVIGVHLAAYGGRVARDLLTAVQLPDQPYVIAQQDVAFRGSVYPGEPINWVKDGESVSQDGSIEYRLVVPGKEGQRPRVEHTTLFAPRWTPFEEKEKQVIYQEDLKIDPKEIKKILPMS